MLGRLAPRSAAYVLQGFPVDRSVRVLSAMEEAEKQRIYNAMSNHYLVRVFDSMPPQQAAQAYTTLQGATVRRMTKNVPESRLELLLQFWDDKDLIFVLTNFSPVKAAYIMGSLPEEQQTAILPQLQTWVQSALIKDMPPEMRAEVIDRMQLEQSIDLLTRWSLKDQSMVLRSVNKARRQEIFNSMRPRSIAEMLEHWPHEEVLSLLNNMEDKQMTMILFNFEAGFKKAIFTIISPDKQRYVISNLQTSQAIEFLRFLPDEEIRDHLNALDHDTRKLLIRAFESGSDEE